jgi:hypothetical protein
MPLRSAVHGVARGQDLEVPFPVRQRQQCCTEGLRLGSEEPGHGPAIHGCGPPSREPPHDQLVDAHPEGSAPGHPCGPNGSAAGNPVRRFPGWRLGLVGQNCPDQPQHTQAHDRLRLPSRFQCPAHRQQRSPAGVPGICVPSPPVDGARSGCGRPQLQTPDTQVSPVAQRTPQSPQFCGSLDVSTQATTAANSNGGSKDGAQYFTGAGGHWHAPATHVPGPHPTQHVPQLSWSV